MNEIRLLAHDRVKSAKIVFTTCAGAGLGILRKVDFEIAILDGASQITEACALIPLVKGCKKAILVGDQYVFVPEAWSHPGLDLTLNHLVSNSARWFEIWRKRSCMMFLCLSDFTLARVPRECPRRC